MKINLNQKEKIIAIYIFVVGVLVSLLVPTWQTPDEYTHLRMIGSSLGRADFAENILDSIDISFGRIEHNYDEKAEWEAQKNALIKKPDYTRAEMLPRSVDPSIIKHLPAALGIIAGILLGIPTYWVLQLGELFALFFYTFICYYSLKIMPLKKEVLAIIMLFPMTIQQAGSIGYDAVMIPLCFFLTAFIFYLKYDKESVNLKDFIIIALVWLIISYIKIPYVFFILLVFLVPLEKIDVNLGFIKIDDKVIKRLRLPVCIFIIILGFIVLYLFRGNTHIQNVYGFVTEWRRGLYLFKATGQTWTDFLMISTVGNLGWLDTPMPFLLVIFVFVCLLAFALIKECNGREEKLKKWDIFILVGTAVILCVFITLSMVNHTIMVTLFGSEQAEGVYNIREAMYQIPYIGGLQGRYYLPFISLLFLAVPQKIDINGKVVRLAFVIIEFMIYVYIICLLFHRYWIA